LFSVCLVSGFRCQRLCSSFLTPDTLGYGTKMGLKLHLYTRRFSPTQYLPVRLYPMGESEDLFGLAVLKTVLRQIFIKFHRIAAVKTCLAKFFFGVFDSG
jgi:hypothetical protein